ncbi:MAG: hypothetical protein QW372_00720 [Nitrososphaerales archaeon]
MARALITLTPTQSKKLMAMAILKMDIVKNALKDGMLVLHPSSSTYFIIKEALGIEPPTNFWVSGIIVEKGLCVEIGSLLPSKFSSKDTSTFRTKDPGEFDRTWLIKGGKLEIGMKLKSILEMMNEKCVYIKGVNALDPQGKVGVLIGNVAGWGTIGLVNEWMKKNHFKVIYIAGFEKLIPTSLEEAAKIAKERDYLYCMGLPCRLFICEGGEVLTETKAIEILSKCKATVISAGGLSGAEGSVVMVIEGDEESLKNAMKYIKRAKDANLPQVRTFYCSDCPHPNCSGIKMPED